MIIKVAEKSYQQIPEPRGSIPEHHLKPFDCFLSYFPTALPRQRVDFAGIRGALSSYPSGQGVKPCFGVSCQRFRCHETENSIYYKENCQPTSRKPETLFHCNGRPVFYGYLSVCKVCIWCPIFHFRHWYMALFQSLSKPQRIPQWPVIGKSRPIPMPS